MNSEKKSKIKSLLLDKTESQLRELIIDIVSRFPDSYEFIFRQEKSEGKVDVNAELAAELWTDAEAIISEFNEYGGGPEEDEEEAHEKIEELSKLLPSLPWQERREIMDDMLKQYHLGNSGFDDVLIDACFEMCKEEQEWLYLAERLLSFGGRWDKKLAMDIYSELGAGDEYLKIRHNSLEYGEDYLDLACHYEEEGDKDKALELAHTGLKKAVGYLGGLLEYLFDYYEEKRDTAKLEKLKNFCESKKSDLEMMYGRLHNYYKSISDYENAKKYILLKFGIVRGHELSKLYADIRDFLSQDDWNKYEADLFAALKERDTTGYLNVCFDKGLKQEVLDFVMRQKAPSKFNYWWSIDYDEFADRLAGDYPREIIEYYNKKAIVLAEAGAGRDRTNYKGAIRHLEKIKNIFTNILNDESAWHHLLAGLRMTYQKRPAFMEESRVLDD